MASSAVQGFNDPYSYNYNSSMSSAMTAAGLNAEVDGTWGTSGIPGLARKIFGEDLDFKKQKAQTMDDREYERQSINSARAWEDYLRSTEYQRKVEDLKKAGLNPWLAVQNGISGTGSASSDTGGSASHQTKSDQSVGVLAQILMAVAKLLE